MIDPKLTYAVVWASNNTEKYWYKVFKDLIEKWFNAIAINPNENEIFWKTSYSTLSDYNWKIDVAIFVLSLLLAFSLAEFVIDIITVIGLLILAHSLPAAVLGWTQKRI